MCNVSDEMNEKNCENNSGLISVEEMAELGKHADIVFSTKNCVVSQKMKKLRDTYVKLHSIEDPDWM